ncbi:competence protein ComGC [Enterococcus sp. PF1-24]|uniref:competence type IV pilus major pilin ComGC n=1 Tax=unclassified Enterococcus TaxID=2608891 RepID=UPI0024735F3E|nr:MULTISPECIES: competence type IV pilus major pilin ComGC [unclassified Enterococcus]MDH6365554.1 competence protein ComGC [Enterococcus sp. PFB1-1]MDH6402656.1 competence protein ComGC [Enterococcus sp. PF1-24]
MKKIFKNNRGFTLLEMLLVLFVIGILILLFIPNINAQRDKVTKKGDAAIVKVIETQQQLYMMDNETEEVPDPSKLADEQYITNEQLEKYNEAKNNGKTE